MKDGIRNCPHCGATAKYHYNDSFAWVRCTRCGCQTERRWDGKRAIREWNTRARNKVAAYDDAEAL